MSPAVVSTLILFCLGGTSALYKQWVLSTNFENGTNWDKGTVPCSSDRIHFLAQRQVSVYVETAHSVLEMSLPLDGEFILPQGAGFMASNGDGGCGPGSKVTFRDSEDLQWFDPSLWQAASSWDDLGKGSFLFSVHEESVPCLHDDVIFRAASSFRVDTTADKSSVAVKTVSVLGQKFSSSGEFTRYLASRSGQLQFHGRSSVHPECRKPLHPVGHCCDICGAIIQLQITTTFNLESYRQRLQHLFLFQPLYRDTQMAISKVSETHWLLKLVPGAATAEVQVLLLDRETGAESGTVAEDLARDIVKDAHSQGEHLGITSAEFKASSGSNSKATGGGMALVASIVVVVVLVLFCLFALGFLFQRGIVKVPSLPSLSSWRRSSDIEELGGPLDRGFDNPMFDKPIQIPAELGVYTSNTESSITVTSSGIHFVNPVYSETDFSA
ncbi:protein amnionless [Arapaima gigas]